MKSASQPRDILLHRHFAVASFDTSFSGDPIVFFSLPQISRISDINGNELVNPLISEYIRIYQNGLGQRSLSHADAFSDAFWQCIGRLRPRLDGTEVTGSLEQFVLKLPQLMVHGEQYLTAYLPPQSSTSSQPSYVKSEHSENTLYNYHGSADGNNMQSMTENDLSRSSSHMNLPPYARVAIRSPSGPLQTDESL